MASVDFVLQSPYIWLAIPVSFLLIFLTYQYLLTTRKSSKRFRKRDRILFYGRRFIRRLRKIKRKQFKKLTEGSKPPVVWTGNTNDNKAIPRKAFKTICLFPNSTEVPLSSFCRELEHALTANFKVLHLNSEKILDELGQSAFDESKQHLLGLWLNQRESEHDIVLFQADYGLTQWTKQCLKQSKIVLVAAMAHLEPNVLSTEQKLYDLALPIPIELVLLHKSDTKKPKHTTVWLNLRNWCPHHHIRCPQRVFVRKRTKIKDIYGELSKVEPELDCDFARLSRYLTGRSIGLVLGGGGARGAAHLGIIKAMIEARVPIDIVGGVSIGAFVGALWAQESGDLARATQLARNWSFMMISRWRQILDLTYPATAMFTGAAFNRTIFEVFGDRQIEDLWIPYFTVSTDITHSAPRIHRHGSLWRYVRASMSLSGYLPPLCDPIDGHLLLDGGYVNNLPADVMHQVMGAQTILAVDVGSQDETNLTNYGDTLNGWWLLWNRWKLFGQTARVPSLPEIQSRLAYVSCVRQLEEVKRSNYCFYVRPPIDQFKTMHFSSFDAIVEVGYTYATERREDGTTVIDSIKNRFKDYNNNGNKIDD